MLTRLITKEILEHLMSLRFAIACALCLIVILCSLFVRCQDYAQVLDDYYQETEMEKTSLDSMNHPWRIVWQGVKVYSRPNPLKVFVRGVDDSNGLAVRVSSNVQLRPIMRNLQNTAVPLFPSIDLVSFVGLIMSLMALVFGYDAVCGEKERGTLRLMLSYSVPRHSVLLSKWIGGYVTLIIPFLLTVICGAVIVRIQRDIALNDSQWGRLAVIIVFALLYVAAIYSLSIFVSCLTARASTSVMILLGIWVVLVLAVPNLSPHIAQVLRPAANAQEVEDKRAAASKEIWGRLVEEKMEEYDKEHGFGEGWWRQIDWGSWESRKKAHVRRCYRLARQREGHLERLREYEKIDQRYGGPMKAQIELSRWIGRISPFTCFAMAATELADAGVMESTRYMRQLRNYQKDLCIYAHDEHEAINNYITDNQGEEPEGGWSENRINPVPSFLYAPPAAGDYAKMVAIDAGILAGTALLFFMLSYITFLRYDVR